MTRVTQARGSQNFSRGTRFGLAILLCIVVFQVLALSIPVAYAATPTLDCANPTSCVANAAAAANCNGGGKKCALSVTGTLSTSATDTTPMVIAIVGVTSSSVTISPPTVGGAGMSSLCATTGLAPAIAAFYYQSPGALSGAAISWSGNGATSSDYATLVAFAIQGQITTGTVSDGSCFASSAVTTSTTPSVTVTGLAESNDFIFGSAVSVAPPLATTTGTQAANTDTQVSGLGAAVAYNSGSSGSSSTISFSTGSSGNWVTVGAAIKDSTSTPIPLFPEGILPILVMVTVLFIATKHGRLGSRYRGSGQ